MEPQQQQQQQHQSQLNEVEGSSGRAGGFLCRQSSTRWTPTTDQIRILKDLYYNNGVRSPNAEQIQKISARLRQYGKIEGKNVFYWFQNHKARERQKKRFTSDHVPMQRSGPTTHSAASWKPDPEPSHPKYSNISPTIGVSSASSSSAGIVAVGQMGSYGYGSVTMEKSFRDCSISAGGSNGVVGGTMGWVGVDPYNLAYSTFKVRPTEETLEEEQDEDGAPEIETLSLFPMHGDDIHGYCNLKSDPSHYGGGRYYQTDDHGFKTGSRTSLELSLNSYNRISPDSS